MNKTIIGLIIAGILLISIPVGVRLVQEQQILKSQAGETYSVKCGETQYCTDSAGQQYNIMCTNDCDAPQNKCITDPSCGDPPNCNEAGCPTNVSCTVGAPNGSVQCDSITGGCYSVCSSGGGGICPYSGDNCIYSELKDGVTKCYSGRSDDAGCTTGTPCVNPAGGCSYSCGPVTCPSGGGSGDNPAPSGSVTTQCNGVKTWAEIWSGLETAAWDAPTPWNKDAALAKYNELSCAGGGGACSVSNWRFSYQNLTDNFPVNTLIKATVQGVSDPGGWQDIRYKRETDSSWVPNVPFTISGTTFSFDVDSGSTGKHTVTFGVNGGAQTCTPTGSFTTGVAAGGPPPSSLTCPSTITSTQVMFNTPNDQEWRNQNVTITKNGNVTVAGFHNRNTTVTPPTDIVLSYVGPDGTFGNNIENNKQFTPTRVGTYTFTAQTKDTTTNNIYTGDKCTDSKSFTVSAIATTATPAPPTPSPTPSDACDVKDDQKVMARMRVNDQQLWSTDTYVSAGNTVSFAGFYGQQTNKYGEDIDLTIYGPIINRDKTKAYSESLNTAQQNPVSKKIDIAGDYIVTAQKHGKKAGGNCTGTANLHVSGAVTTTKEYRASENLADFALDPSPNPLVVWKPYTSDGMLVDYTFSDRNAGQKFIYVEFKDNNEKQGGCGADYKPTSDSDKRTHPCRMPIKLIDSAQIAGCLITFDGSNTVINLQGNNFEASPGEVVGNTTVGRKTGTRLSVKTWEEGNVSANWSNAPQGKNLYITLTTKGGQYSTTTCSPTSQLALGVKTFCQAVSACDREDAELVLQDATTGDILVNQKVTIGADGVVKGLNQKLIAEKKYNLSIKTSKSLRRNRQFTAVKNGGTTNIFDFVLPMGDIFQPGGEGDGKIAGSDYSLMLRDWNTSKAASNKVSDLDCNERVNSFDWACLRYDYNKEGDPKLIPGVPLVGPSATPEPGTTVTPAPGQPGVCTLGMYVKFENTNAYSVIPSVNLALFPPASDPTPNAECKSENGCTRLSNVPVTPATVNNINQDVFLITNGNNPLNCGETYNVVVLSAGFKQSIFPAVKVTDDPTQYASFLYTNQSICKATSTSCNHNCLRSDPNCVTP
ncbi:hypothetical protein KKE03_04860 [Patescibacteria group bacterium]|nr:hypothetical protein [Patescibacteria group bacterium]